jgi:hypothetical protein
MINSVRTTPCYVMDGKIHHKQWSPLYDSVKKYNRYLKIYKFKNHRKVREQYRGHSPSMKPFKSMIDMWWLDADYFETRNRFVYVTWEFKNISSYRFQINHVKELGN